MHGPRRGTSAEELYAPRCSPGRRDDHDDRGAGSGGNAPSSTESVRGAPRAPVRLLHAGDDHDQPGLTPARPGSRRRCDPARACRQSLPLHRISDHPRIGSCRGELSEELDLIAAAFEYTRAGSIEDALEALADPEARAIAGGHSLVPMMKLRLARPSRLVDIGGLDFRGVTDDREGLRIGALTTYHELVSLDAALGLPDALRECASSVGDLQVRNAGTVGGGIAHGDPA